MSCFKLTCSRIVSCNITKYYTTRLCLGHCIFNNPCTTVYVPDKLRCNLFRQYQSSRTCRLLVRVLRQNVCYTLPFLCTLDHQLLHKLLIHLHRHQTKVYHVLISNGSVVGATAMRRWNQNCSSPS